MIKQDNNQIIIAGVDEAGVGPLAGPVVAAAVILNPKQPIYKLRDSKVLKPEQREVLFVRIMQKALAVSVGFACACEIDEINIYHATMHAMTRAIYGLAITPTLVLIDGRATPKIDYNMQAIVDGDATEKSISAASIIAKVTRDRFMQAFSKCFPEYCFNQHKGYSTKIHQRMLEKYGPCIIHRRSFKTVQKFLR